MTIATNAPQRIAIDSIAGLRHIRRALLDSAATMTTTTAAATDDERQQQCSQTRGAAAAAAAEEFVDSLLGLAAPNVSVNGRVSTLADFRGPRGGPEEDEDEPFDEVLNREVQELQERINEARVRLAGKRATYPDRIVADRRRALEVVAGAADVGDEEDGDDGMDVDAVEVRVRDEEALAGTCEEVVSTIDGLLKDVAALTDKWRRAATAIDDVTAGGATPKRRRSSLGVAR